jgi:subtilisin-like proprotein convertase family protein
LSVLSLVLFLSGTTLFAQDAAPEVVFTNSTPITVGTGTPNNGSLYPSPIAVSGLPTSLPTTPGSIKVTINNFSHTYSDDVGIVLVGPTGAALLLQDGAGDDPDMTGVTYSFSDAGTANLPDLTAWTAGTYKPTAYYSGDSFPAPGPLLAYANPGPINGGTATFASVFGGTNPNGTWKLYVRDFVNGDGGSLAGGWSIEFTGGTTPPANVQHVVDFNGDGKTDYAVVRNIGGTTGGQVRWFINLNGTTTTYGSDWGISTDFFLPVDFDGDSKSDIAVWRPATAANGGGVFYILQSNGNTVRIENFGLEGDDPSVVDDYDGDNKADLAVYREGAAAGQQSTWFYRGSLNNPSGNVTYVNWGINGDFPSPGDYDGDNKADFVVQRNNGGGQARFWLLQTTAGTDSVVFGTPSDSIVPGDYDGDGKTDIATARGVGGSIQWYVRPSSTGVVSGSPYATFGASATDFLAQGDYDGDGRTDPAVWRSSSTPGVSAFWVLGSTVGAYSVPFGAGGDYPVANFNVH